MVVESVCVAAAGGLLGLGLAYPLIQQGLGGWVEANMGRFIPYFRISSSTAGMSVGLATVLGLVAAILPALGAMRRSVSDALRQVT